ncbi:Lar family restriction alleviation protein [Pectinatus frisingensis]|uniref:Lar family restriction alleviation protein n=1 Tax=Pectinatus frisingensis TaxID=865 RepID=UPI0018C7911D|nr:Lar family restriction alleviation protein [Pectinatus frisingensis]
MEKLKPCPFCGSRPFIEDDSCYNASWHIFCPNCGCSQKWNQDIETAIENWNMRAEHKKAAQECNP